MARGTDVRRRLKPRPVASATEDDLMLSVLFPGLKEASLYNGFTVSRRPGDLIVGLANSGWHL